MGEGVRARFRRMFVEFQTRMLLCMVRTGVVALSGTYIGIYTEELSAPRDSRCMCRSR